LEFPIQTLKVGSLGTHNALGLAKQKRAVFMLASTSEVYGDPLMHPQPESYWGHVNCIGVRGCYDESKRFAEAITMAYHRVHKIDTKIARIFNTFGSMMRIHDGRVVPNFIYQALNNQPLSVYGSGRQTRSFCYIDDLVEGIFRLMLSRVNEPVNLGNPQEFTILKLANLVSRLTKTKAKIVFKPLPQDDPRQRQPDITRAKKFLKWQPKIELEEGLKRTIIWFAQHSL
jgi:dTDP-glucose 4,6-dehydratase